MGHKTDPVAFFSALAEAPYRYDFYQTLRQIECLSIDKPRWAQAVRPADEPVRLGQEPSLSFAPASLASFGALGNDVRPHLQVQLFGLLGPNGPLPIHITDYIRERSRHAGDPALSRFLDLFHHRFIALFYRAWAQAQPHVSRDRPDDDQFITYIGAFLGLAPATMRDRDSLPDVGKVFHAGALAHQARNADGLAAILRQFFQLPVRIQEFVGHWLILGVRERTYLAGEGASLGCGAVLGGRVWDRQYKFRIHLGPLTLTQYESFLPGGKMLKKLADWTRLYVGFELEWDVCLLLKQNEVPSLLLGRQGRLGWTTWLGKRPSPLDAGDLCLDVEEVIKHIGAAA